MLQEAGEADVRSLAFSLWQTTKERFKEVLGVVGRSVGKVLTTQPRGPKFKPQNAHLRTSCDGMYNLSAERQEWVDP